MRIGKFQTDPLPGFGCLRARMLAINLVRIRLAMLGICLLLLSPVAQAQLTGDVAKELENRHRGEFLRVRELVADAKIHYDAAGQLMGKWHAGRWTWPQERRTGRSRGQGQHTSYQGESIAAQFQPVHSAIRFGASGPRGDRH